MNDASALDTVDVATATPDRAQPWSELGLKEDEYDRIREILGRRPTSLAARGVVDGEGRLELRGEASGIGEALRADLVGELTDFPLASANPYAQATGWIVGDGRLTAKVHYRVEGDQLIGEHDLLLSDLKVEQAREGDLVKQRIGLPLGLIVALLKDTGGDIDFTVPISTPDSCTGLPLRKPVTVRKSV